MTSAPGAYWQTDGALTEVTERKRRRDGRRRPRAAQTWEGFGGAFNEIGWNVLSMLSQADRDRAINLLYGADGARFAFGRIPIGASDYAMDRYTLDEIASGDRRALASFSIDRDMEKLIPYVKAAQAVKPQHPLLGQPLDAADLDEAGPVLGGQHGHARSTAGR